METCATCGSALHGTELHDWLEGSEDEEDRTDWPLSPTQEAIFEIEVGKRAWSWAQDCNPYETNDEYEVREMIAGLSGAYYLEGV